MYDVLSEDKQRQNPTKPTSDAVMVTTPEPPKNDSQLITMQQDIASMVDIINTMSKSFHKMEKLDKIDEIDSRQKLSEVMIQNMMSDIRYDIDMIKTTTLSQTPIYADTLKTKEKQNKNNSVNVNEDPNLDTYKQNQTPDHNTTANDPNDGQTMSTNHHNIPPEVNTTPPNYHKFNSGQVKQQIPNMNDDPILETNEQEQHDVSSPIHQCIK